MKKKIAYILDWLYFIFFCTPLAAIVYISVCIIFEISSLFNFIIKIKNAISRKIKKRQFHTSSNSGLNP